MKTIIRMFEHLYWANQRILETLQNLDYNQKNKQTLKLFSHLLFAEQVWLNRLQGKDSSELPIWGEIELAGCIELAKQNEKGFVEYLTSLQGSDLDCRITYCNSMGEEFDTSIRDILSHISLHGHYHRGQINLRLRQDGLEPVSIDYITFVR